MKQEQKNGAHAANISTPKADPVKNPPKDIIAPRTPIRQRIDTLTQEGTLPGAWGYTVEKLTRALTEHVAVHIANGNKLIEAPKAAQETPGRNAEIDTARAYALLLQGLDTPQPNAWQALVVACNVAYEWGRINGRKERSKRRRKTSA